MQHIQYIYFVLVKDGILHKILTYLNVYICKVGMPPPLLLISFCFV